MEDKQRFTDVPGSHARSAGKQSNESNSQDEAPIGAQVVSHKRATLLKRWNKLKLLILSVFWTTTTADGGKTPLA